MATKTWKEIRAKKFSPEQIKRLDEGVVNALIDLDLRELREAAGLTQEELAKRIEVAQPMLSKMERRADMRLSALLRYVGALGGELEVTAVVKGKRIKLVAA